MKSTNKIKWTSVEILEDKTLYTQLTTTRLKHGAKGKVLLGKVLPSFANKIIEENKTL